jgi:hypothetical protein
VAWAELLTDATASSEGLAHTAAAIFGYVYRNVDRPTYPLLHVVFPILYSSLPKHPQRGMFFSDVDRKKTARHELVDMFVRSKWPPADLLIIAQETGVAPKVIGRLLRDSHGRAYLRAIEADLERLSAKSRNALARIIQQAREETDWDY